jgi:DNA-binding response OmpR family regulator
VVGVADERNVALALAEAERPDLVLLDIRLVKCDSGLELAADLRALGLPVLFVTGNCPQDVSGSLALGCLHKPFDERQLVSAVAVANRLLRGERLEAGRLPSGLHLYGAGPLP